MSTITIKLRDPDAEQGEDSFEVLGKASVPGVGDIEVILESDPYGQLKLIDTLFFPSEKWQNLMLKVKGRMERTVRAMNDARELGTGLSMVLLELSEEFEP